MKDVRVDAEGEFHCWNCGNKGLLAKRTGRAHIVGYLTVGVGALATKKKLKCQTCGEYNDTGTAKPYDGPADRKWRKKWEAEQKAKGEAALAAEARQAAAQAAAISAALAQAVPPAGEIPKPPSWQPDPAGRHDVRYWDGAVWTAHVADAGVQANDPL